MPPPSAVRLRLTGEHFLNTLVRLCLNLWNGGVASNSKYRVNGKAEPYRSGERQSRIDMKKKSRHRNTALALIASIVLFPAAHSTARFEGALRSKIGVGSVYDVRSFGAKGDGKTPDTPAVNKTIETAAAAGGGTVYFPAGTYLCLSIHLKSNIALYLDQGATILAADPNTI